MFPKAVAEFVGKKREDWTGVHVLLWNDEYGTHEERFENMAVLCRNLWDIMGRQIWVIAMIVDGKPLPVEKIEELKQQALKELEDMPISHAKELMQIDGGSVGTFIP